MMLNGIHVQMLIHARELLAQRPLTRARFEEAQHNLTVLSALRVRTFRCPTGERLRVFEDLAMTDDSPASVRRAINIVDGILAIYGGESLVA